MDALIIESGYSGLSNYLIKNNYEVKIVNSHSKSYDLRSSYKSETFAFKDKNLALISDNQMRIYLNLDKKLKKKKTSSMGKFKMRKIRRHHEKLLKIFNNEFQNLKKIFLF